MIKKPFTLLALALLTATLAAEDARPDYRNLEFPAAPEFEPPRPERRELSNGIIVYVLEDREFPLISINMTIRTGSVHEPADRLGLAAITGELMRLGGTEKHAPEDLDRALEDMASSVETSIGTTSGSASASMLTENLEATVELLADVVRRPRFAEDKLDLILGQLRTAIQARNDDGSAVAGREFSRLLYGRDHPRSRVQELEHVDAITLDAVRAFHAQTIVPGSCIVGVVGDISTEEAVALLEKHFGDWQGETPELADVPEADTAVPGVYYADLSSKGVTQTSLRIGHMGVRRDNPDYPAIIMMNYMLGGGGFGTSRLLNEVRTKRGLAYSVYSSFRGQYDSRGTFFAGCDTKAESTVAAIEAILGEIERIRDEQVGAEELDAARREILNAQIFSYDSPEDVLSRAITYEFHDYPQDLLEQTLAALQKVTAEEIHAAAKKYLQPDNLIILAVGDQAKFDAPLSSLERGDINEVDVSIPVPSKSTETIDFTDDAAVKQAQALAAKVVATQGGRETIESTESMRVKMKLDRAAGGGMPPMTILGERLTVAPDRIRFDADIGGMMKMVQVATADGGWVKQGPQVMDMPPPMRDGLIEEAAQLGGSVWLDVLAGEVEAAAGAIIDERGRKAQLVGVKEAENPSIYYIDVETGHILRQVNVAEGARTEVVFDDYQDVAGRQISMQRQQLVNGDKQMDITMEKVEFNVEVDDALFARPE